MEQKIFRDLIEKQNIRSSLSELRRQLREGTAKSSIQRFVEEQEELFFGFLEEEDPKTRKNAALLLGDLAYRNAADALFHAYEKEETLFVKSAYLEALQWMDARKYLPALKKRLEELLSEEIPEENRKHVREEIRSLRKLILPYEGIMRHTFLVKESGNHILLETNRDCREILQQKLGGKIHPLGVIVNTDDLQEVLQVRIYRNLLFPVPVKSLLPSDPKEAAQMVWKSALALCRKYHRENTPFYFRTECRALWTLDKRSRFTKQLGDYLEEYSDGNLVNSAGNYEVELRLISDKTGRFFPCLRFTSLPDHRFDYRKESVSSSMHPSTAAMIAEIAKPYLKENARILDPFCGVGTLLIERNLAVPAGYMYGTDIFGEAVKGARRNGEAAGENIQFIQKDFFEFQSKHLFDEIITDMPVRGKKTREELEQLYDRFFRKVHTLMKPDAVIIMYTGELGFVRKQLRLHPEFQLVQETCMQEKKGFYLLVIRVKG